VEIYQLHSNVRATAARVALASQISEKMPEQMNPRSGAVTSVRAVPKKMYLRVPTFGALFLRG